MRMPCGRVAESVGKTLNSQRRSDAISEAIDHLLEILVSYVLVGR